MITKINSAYFMPGTSLHKALESALEKAQSRGDYSGAGACFAARATILFDKWVGTSGTGASGANRSGALMRAVRSIQNRAETTGAAANGKSFKNVVGSAAATLLGVAAGLFVEVARLATVMLKAPLAGAAYAIGWPVDFLARRALSLQDRILNVDVATANVGVWEDASRRWGNKPAQNQ